MTSTYSPSINLEEPGLGDYNGSWQIPLNSNFTIIDQKFGVETTVNTTGGTTVLTNVQSAYWAIIVAGALTANATVQLPATVGGTWIFYNNTTGTRTVTIKGSPSDTGFVLAQGTNQVLWSNGAAVSQPLNSGAIIAGLGYTPANKAGDTFTGAVTVSTGGLTVTSGGIVITANGLTVNGGGIDCASGQLLVGAGGIAVGAGSVSLASGTFTVTAGLSTLGGGLVSSGTTTVPTVAATDNSTNAASTAFVNNAFPGISAAQAFVAVGSYVIANYSNTPLNPGATVAGSAITIGAIAGGTAYNPAAGTTWIFLGAVIGTTGFSGLFKRLT